MSLLEKATIITTPTAHGNGTLHSIKGGAVADFDVVRGSAATRVNAEGLIEDISILSGELVTNGDFTTDSNWSKGSGWTIIGGEAVFNGSAFGGVLLQSSALVVGKKYLVSLDVISGSVRIKTGTSSYTTYTEPFTVDANLNGDIAIQSLSSVSSIDNISIIEVIDATNIPRIDYTTGEGVVLLEPQSTNLIPYSQDFSNAAWIKDASTTLTGGQASPDGGNNAYKVEGTIGSSFLLDGGFSAITPQSRSIYMRADTNGVIYTLGDSQSNQINVSTEWQRFELQEVSNAFYGVDFRGVGVTLDTVYIWGAQVEALSYATSYIPTSGAIATRLADSLTGAGDATTFNSTEGVLYAEIAKRQDSNDNFILISLNNDASNSDANSVTIGFGNSVNFYVRVKSPSGDYTSQTILASSNEFHKIAIRYEQANIGLFIDGIKEATYTGNYLFTQPLDNLSFDYNGNGTLPFYGKVKALAVFNEALTDLELECLTKI